MDDKQVQYRLDLGTSKGLASSLAHMHASRTCKRTRRRRRDLIHRSEVNSGSYHIVYTIYIIKRDDGGGIKARAVE
jgi:hypothetical protein